MAKKGEIEEYARTLGWPVTQADVEAVKRLFGPISDSYLRKVLLGSGAPLDPLVEGVRQDSFEALERTLLQLQELYVQGAAGTRSMVIQAKDHAKLAARRESAASVKQEMVLWMLTWLENPALFPDWLALRKRATGVRSTPPE